MRRGYWEEERKRAHCGMPDIRDTLTDPVSVIKAAKFMKATGLLGHFKCPNVDQDEGETVH